MFPGGPFANQITVGDQHTGRVFMAAEHTHRFAALHQQGLIVTQPFQNIQDLVETLPIAGRLTQAAVYDQVFRPLRHLRVQVILYHAECGFSHPVFTMQGIADGRLDDAGLGTHTMRSLGHKSTS